MKYTFIVLMFLFIACFYNPQIEPMPLDNYLATITSSKIIIDTIIVEIPGYEKSDKIFSIFDFSVKNLKSSGYSCDTCDYPIEIHFSDTLLRVEDHDYISKIVSFHFENENYILISFGYSQAMGTTATYEVSYLFSKDMGRTKIYLLGGSFFNTAHNVGDFDGDGILEFATIARINPWSDSLVIGFANIQREDVNEINCILGTLPTTSILFKELKKSPCKDFFDD